MSPSPLCGQMVARGLKPHFSHWFCQLSCSTYPPWSPMVAHGRPCLPRCLQMPPRCLPDASRCLTSHCLGSLARVIWQESEENPKNPGWCLSQIKGLGPSGVLPLESSRKVSMNAESFSPYSPIFVPIVKNWYQKLVRDPILGFNSPHSRGVPLLF